MIKKNQRKLFCACCTFIIIIIVIMYSFCFAPQKDVITLVADTLITKKKPSNPGGLTLPHANNLVYKRLQNDNNIDRIIHILPDPEEPLDIID